jgi:outer membrane biosynthesis protein TonB
MAPDPEHRYDNLETLRRELVPVRREMETAAAYETTATSVRFAIPAPANTTRVRSRPLPWLVSGALVAAFGTGLWLLPDRASQPPERPAPFVGAPISIASSGAAPPETPAAQPEAPKPSETIGNQAKTTPTPPRAQSAATPPVDVPPPPAAARPIEAPVAEQPAPLPQPPVAEVRSKDFPPPPSEAPPPVADKTARAQTPAPEDAVRAALHAYEAAYADRDVGALRAIYPNLSQTQAEAMGKMFAGAVSYEVKVDVLDLRVAGSQASAACNVTHVLVPKVGNPSRNTAPMRFELRQTDGAWRIERVDRASQNP